MAFKVTLRKDGIPYDSGYHYNCRTTILHAPEDVDNGELEVGLDLYLPGAGTNPVPAELETIYYVQKGEMTADMGDGQEHVLKVGDSIHFGRGAKCAMKNKASAPAEVLAMRIKPLTGIPTEMPEETKYKITRSNEFYSYAPVPDTHKNCLTCRLHNAKDVNQGRFEVGISFYLPGGGVHMPGDQYEMVYYVTEGVFTSPTPEGGECPMHPGDSVHFASRNFRISHNHGDETVTMITIRVLPEGDPLCGK